MMERRRAVEREATELVALHGEDAGLIARHLATHPELGAEARRRWHTLARAIGRVRRSARDLRVAASCW